MVGQHDAAGAHPNRFSGRGKMTDYDRSGRARNAGHVVMLGDPIPMITPRLRLNSKRFAALKGAGCVAAKGDGN